MLVTPFVTRDIDVAADVTADVNMLACFAERCRAKLEKVRRVLSANAKCSLPLAMQQQGW